MNTLNMSKPNAETYTLVPAIRKTHAEFMIGVLPKDRTQLKCIALYVIAQCVIAFAAIGTILACLWNPEKAYFELDILARVMYLYDTDACGKARLLSEFRDFHLNNDTHGLPIKPIKHAPVFLSVLTKLSGKTRTYLKVSVALHCFWMSAAALMWINVFVKDLKVFKVVLRIFYCITIAVITFDVCMGIVFMAHIQQSLTKAMIIRYSGWGMVPRKVLPEEFGGWVPLIAAIVWMRGGIFLMLNIYVCRCVKQVLHKIRGREVKHRMRAFYNLPFPDAQYEQEKDNTLYFRAGQYKF